MKNWKSFPGFTLLEVMLVFAMIGILTATGLASFFSYSQTQSYSLAVSDIESLMQLARSRALSNVKPTQCGTFALRSYQMSFNVSGGTYTMSVVCSNGSVTPLKQAKLPNNVTFDSGTTATISFAASTAIATPAPSTVTITGYGKTKTFTVNSAGIISLQ